MLELKIFESLEKVEELNNVEFRQLINNLFAAVKEIKINIESACKIWRNVYNETFNRSYDFDDYSIVSLHWEFNDILSKNKELLKQYKEEIKEVITLKQEEKTSNCFNDLHDLENFFRNVVKENLNISKINFSLLFKEYKEHGKTYNFIDGSIFEFITSRILKDNGRGNWVMEYRFSTPLNLQNECRSVIIKMKTKYIKSRDQFSLKELISIESY